MSRTSLFLSALALLSAALVLASNITISHSTILKNGAVQAVRINDIPFDSNEFATIENFPATTTDDNGNIIKNIPGLDWSIYEAREGTTTRSPNHGPAFLEAPAP